MSPQGFSVVNSEELTRIGSTLVLEHIICRIKKNFDSLEDAAEFIITERFDDFKEKSARTLPKHLSEKFLRSLQDLAYIDSDAQEFVTDEEKLGYANVYWRIVRKNSQSDVGPIHADKWFWELTGAPFPRTHTRVKVWMPLLQDDQNPSLVVLPGSQIADFDYSSRIDRLGRLKPVFKNPAVAERMERAPVRVGEAIIFHDSLLHGGMPTDKNRISIEFTIGVQNKSLDQG